MSEFRSGFSQLVEMFIAYRKASGSWSEPCYGLNIKLFDHYCADNYGPDTPLTQEMADDWCTKKDTESNRSNEVKTRVVSQGISRLSPTKGAC